MLNQKIIALFLTFFLLLSLCACGISREDGTRDTATDAPSNSTTDPASSTAPQTGTTDNPFTEDAQIVGQPTTLPDPTTAAPSTDRALPRTKIEHSYGVAKDGQPHSISVNNQAFFDSKGYRALCLDTKTQEKVLYLTFDCGWENGYTAKILDVLKEKQVPAAFFCTVGHLKDQPALIRRMIDEGHIVGNHSTTHPDFSTLSRAQMAQEIKTCDDYLRENFHYTAPYFRFPEGAYSEDALDLVGSLGYLSVFWSCSYADWDVSKQNGAAYALETVTARLHPGAVILLHAVSPDNAGAMADIIDWARAQGYEFRSLDQYPI